MAPRAIMSCFANSVAQKQAENDSGSWNVERLHVASLTQYFYLGTASVSTQPHLSVFAKSP